MGFRALKEMVTKACIAALYMHASNMSKKVLINQIKKVHKLNYLSTILKCYLANQSWCHDSPACMLCSALGIISHFLAIYIYTLEIINTVGIYE